MTEDRVREGLSETDRAAGRLLFNFAQWAMAETAAGNLGEAVGIAAFAGPPPDEWRNLAAEQLSNIAPRVPHPYRIISSWVDSLGPRESEIFAARVAPLRSLRTLEEIASDFHVTRERIRQLEKAIRGSLKIFLASADAAPVVWRSDSVANRAGVAAPEAALEDLLEPPGGDKDLRDVILELAGPYSRADDGWLIRRDAGVREPTQAILAGADAVGRIDLSLAARELSKWGLKKPLHAAWLRRFSGVREFDGRFYRWGRSVADRLAVSLAELKRPATLEELMEHIGEKRTRGTCANALSRDPRTLRVTMSECALATWGRPEYQGIARSMRTLLDEEGGVCAGADCI